MAELPGEIIPVTPATPSRRATRKGARRQAPSEPHDGKQEQPKKEQQPGHIDDYA